MEKEANLCKLELVNCKFTANTVKIFTDAGVTKLKRKKGDEGGTGGRLSDTGCSLNIVVFLKIL